MLLRPYQRHPQASMSLPRASVRQFFDFVPFDSLGEGKKYLLIFICFFLLARKLSLSCSWLFEVLWLWWTCFHPAPILLLNCCFSVYTDWIRSFCWMYCKQSPGVSFVFFFCLWKTSVPAEARQATHASEAGSLRLAAPTGHKPAATTCQDGSQCASEIFFFLEMPEIWIFMGKVLGWFFLSFFPFFSVLRQGLMQPMLALNSLCSWGLPWTFEPSAFTSPVKGLQTWTLTDGLRTTEKWTLNFAHRRQLLYWATSPGLLGKMLSFAKDLFGPGWMCKTAVLQPSLGALFYCKGLWIFTLVCLFHLDSGVPLRS